MITISFVIGLFDILSLANFMYQKELLHMQPNQMQLVMGIIAIPWCIKPLFGYLVDQLIQKIKYTRFMVICLEALRVLVLITLASQNLSTWQFYMLIFINSMCTMFDNIVCEYILVVSSKAENEARGTSNANHLPIFFGFRAMGSLIGNFFGGRIIKYHSVKTAYHIAAYFPLLVLTVAFFYSEPPVRVHAKPRSLGQELAVMKDLLSQNNVLQMILFVCLINMTPNFDVVFAFYMTDFLKFSTEDLANFSTIAAISYIIGLYVYTLISTKIQPRKFFITTNFILLIINASFFLVVSGFLRRMGVSEKAFCLLTQGVYSLVAELNYMPIIAVWCAVCPRNLEATSITLFTGLMNLSSNLSNYFGSGLTWGLGIQKEHFDKVYILVLVQNAYLLFAMLGVLLVRFPQPEEKEGREVQLEETVD